MACAEAPKKEQETEETPTEEVVESNEETMMEEGEDISFMLPSPIQIAAIFNRAGLNYESGLCNSTDNLSKYNTKTAKYLNFGVYSADLAYAVLNNQQQESIDYLNAVKVLADEIGMPSVFGSGELIESFEKNVGNQDTILRILTTIKRRTDEYLAENAQESKEAIFFSAAWLEGMYLGANSVSDQNKLTPRLIEQMTILENVIKAVKAQKDPSLDVNFLVEGLTQLHNTFEGFESVKALNGDNMDIDQVSLSAEELATLNQQITELRNKVVNG
jgi:hypothetical protein